MGFYMGNMKNVIFIRSFVKVRSLSILYGTPSALSVRLRFVIAALKKSTVLLDLPGRLNAHRRR